MEIQVLDSVSILNFVDHFSNSSPVAKFSTRQEQDTIRGPKDFLQSLINFLPICFYFMDYLENWNGQLVLKESFESFVLGCGES